MSGKLNYAAVDDLIAFGTTTDIDFMIYISGICNEFGSVRDLCCRDICLILNIDKSTFYRTKDRLVRMGLILANDNREWGLWNITINNNIYRTKEDYKTGYMQTNRDFLTLPEFKNSFIKIKRLVLMLLKASNVHNFRATVSTISKWVCSSIEETKAYMETIKAWYEVKLQGNIYYIKLKPIFDKSAKSNNDKYLIHRIKALLSKYSIPYTTQELLDTIILFHQYSGSKLLKLIVAIASTTNRYKLLIPRVINFIVSNNSKKEIVIGGVIYNN